MIAAKGAKRKGNKWAHDAHASPTYITVGTRVALVSVDCVSANKNNIELQMKTFSSNCYLPTSLGPTILSNSYARGVAICIIIVSNPLVSNPLVKL